MLGLSCICLGTILNQFLQHFLASSMRSFDEAISYELSHLLGRSFLMPVLTMSSANHTCQKIGFTNSILVSLGVNTKRGDRLYPADFICQPYFYGHFWMVRWNLGI